MDGFGFSGSDLHKTLGKSKIGDQKYFVQNPKCVTRSLCCFRDFRLVTNLKFNI